MDYISILIRNKLACERCKVNPHELCHKMKVNSYILDARVKYKTVTKASGANVVGAAVRR